ncbi:hypothetical protein TPCV2_05800 [Cutibacterium avidum]|nr:hypothetical protein TPCV4_04500 [Cutibacterium avidum]
MPGEDNPTRVTQSTVALGEESGVNPERSRHCERLSASQVDPAGQVTEIP